MCKLCSSPGIEPFSKEMESSFVSDMGRILRTKEKSPENRAVFTTSPEWLVRKFDFPLFEALGAFPNPQNYYQPITVDGERLRCDWQGNWLRSLGFLPNGNVLLFTKAVGHERFNPESQWFYYFFLVEFTPQELEVEFEPPKMVLRADNVRKEGINLLTAEKDEHTFSFSLASLASEKSFIRADAAEQSSLYQELVRRGRTKEEAQKDGAGAPKGDFERFMVTTLHYTPHPFMLKFFKEFGFESRYMFQSASFSLVEEHFRKLVEAKKA